MESASRFLSFGIWSVLVVVGAVLWVHDHAAAQVRSASRHEAQDRADERGAIQDRIAALYDPTEMARAMELIDWKGFPRRAAAAKRAGKVELQIVKRSVPGK